MKGKLTVKQINYVFYHLNLLVDFNEKLTNRILFVDNPPDVDSIKSNGNIIFQHCRHPLDISKSIEVDGVIYLFPNSKKKEHYKIINGHLIFYHDILKSAFYLLSGYQEQYANNKDAQKRYKYVESVQYKLEFINKPMVNYYFKLIAEGLKQFGKLYGIDITEKKHFHPFGFILSHDIDRVDYFSFHQIKFFTKGLAGLYKTTYTKKQLLYLLIKNVIHYLSPLPVKDPYWNFKWLREQENELEIKSTFYFLLKGIKHHDAYYNVSENRIKKIIKYLENEGCEIGVHGTVGSYKNSGELRHCINRLNKVTSEKTKGIRQHRLKFNHPETFKIQQSEGLLYDTTLGFAEHEGFRNSFCFPFKPYDFEKNQMLNIWEIPLMVMDVTLFGYRKLSFEYAFTKIEYLMSEIKKFNGILTLLWHNSYFDEIKLPGIKNFYADLLKMIMEENPKTETGIGTIQQIEKQEN